MTQVIKIHILIIFKKSVKKCAVVFFWFMPFSEVLFKVEFLAKSFDLQSVFPNKETQLP
mgnify:CR=1 FL=1